MVRFAFARSYVYVHAQLGGKTLHAAIWALIHMTQNRVLHQTVQHSLMPRVFARAHTVRRDVPPRAESVDLATLARTMCRFPSSPQATMMR